MAKNIYKHKIDLDRLEIRNTERKQFAQRIIDIHYKGYIVEEFEDGREIVITKPGGKSVYGHPKKEDILVFIYNPVDDSLWQISHQQILDDVTKKCQENPEEGRRLIGLLEKTLNGEEPNDFINDIHSLSFSKGEPSEELIKAYKWIWGQEDVNYPNGEGRMLSWNSYKELLEKL